MNFQLNLDDLTTDLRQELETHFKLIIARVNQVTAFCNLANQAEIFPVISELWTDKSIIPNTHRLSSPNFSIQVDAQIIQRSLLNNDKDSVFSNLTNELDKQIQSNTVKFYKQSDKKVTIQHEYALEEFSSNQQNTPVSMPLEHSLKGHLAFVEICQQLKLMLEVAKVHAQCIIAQTASIKSLDKTTKKINQLYLDSGSESSQQLTSCLAQMKNVILQHQLVNLNGKPIDVFNRNEVLALRKKFTELCSQSQEIINQSHGSNQDKLTINSLLEITKKCYYAKNDVNFTYPLQGSHSWSSTKHNFYRNASKVSLIATLTALVSGGIAFFFPPFGFVAAGAGAVAVVTGAPVAIAKFTETMSNIVKYHAAPSTGECFNIGLLATSLLSMGLEQTINNSLTAVYSATNNSIKLISCGLGYVPAQNTQTVQDIILLHGEHLKSHLNDQHHVHQNDYNKERAKQDLSNIAGSLQST